MAAAAGAKRSVFCDNGGMLAQHGEDR
jgi:hypothetical protein